MIKKWISFGLFNILMAPFCNTIAAEVDVINENLFDVYVPANLSSDTFTAGFLYLRPGGSNDYAVLVNPFNPNVPAPILSPSWEPQGINPDFSPGFSVNFRHVFPRSGNHVNFYWGHFRASDNATFAVNREPPPAQQFAGPFWNVGPDAGTTSSADGHLNNKFDVLNGEVGKYLNVDPDLIMRLFAGISALWIQQTLTANFSGIDPILGPYNFGIKTRSKFSSAGLRLGVDGKYHAWNGMSVVGLLAGNLYIGSQQPSTTSTGSGSVLTNAGISVNHQSISHDSYIQLVPALDTKIGLQYSCRYSHDKSFALEAGYMASIYTNALQNYVPSTYVPGSLGIVAGSVYLQSLLKTTDSFSLDGPYATFSLKI